MDDPDAKIKQYAKKGHLFLDGDVINKAKKFKSELVKYLKKINRKGFGLSSLLFVACLLC
jgi:hypothetical protein